MVEALIGLLRDSVDCTPKDVKVYLSKFDGLKYKMMHAVSDDVCIEMSFLL